MPVIPVIGRGYTGHATIRNASPGQLEIAALGLEFSIPLGATPASQHAMTPTPLTVPPGQEAVVQTAGLVSFPTPGQWGARVSGRYAAGGGFQSQVFPFDVSDPSVQIVQFNERDNSFALTVNLGMPVQDFITALTGAGASVDHVVALFPAENPGEALLWSTDPAKAILNRGFSIVPGQGYAVRLKQWPAPPATLHGQPLTALPPSVSARLAVTKGWIGVGLAGLGETVTFQQAMDALRALGHNVVSMAEITKDIAYVYGSAAAAQAVLVPTKGYYVRQD